MFAHACIPTYLNALHTLKRTQAPTSMRTNMPLGFSYWEGRGLGLTLLRTHISTMSCEAYAFALLLIASLSLAWVKHGQLIAWGKHGLL